jgi:hypothetical protein
MVLTTHPLSSAKVKKGWSYTSIYPLGQLRPITGVLYLLITKETTASVVIHMSPNSRIFVSCCGLVLHKFVDTRLCVDLHQTFHSVIVM